MTVLETVLNYTTMFLLVTMVTSIIVFLAKPRSYWALVLGIAGGIISYAGLEYWTSFTDIALQPAIRWIVYNMTWDDMTVYIFGSFMVLIGAIIICIVSLYNIIDTWNEDAISIFQ